MTTFLTLGLLRENRKIGKRESRENPIYRIKSYLGSGSVSESGSGSIITDGDPDPHQNDTDPKHCKFACINMIIFSY